MSLPNSTSHCLGKISPLQARGDPCSGWVNVPTKATHISFKSGSLNSFLGVLVIVTSNLGLGDFFFLGKKRFTHRPLGECPTTLWGAWTCLCLHLVSFNGDLKKKKAALASAPVLRAGGLCCERKLNTTLHLIRAVRGELCSCYPRVLVRAFRECWQG